MPRSAAEVRWAHSALESGKGSDKQLAYAREVVSGMHGRKMSELPERASKLGKTLPRLSKKKSGGIQY